MQDFGTSTAALFCTEVTSHSNRVALEANNDMTCPGETGLVASTSATEILATRYCLINILILPQLHSVRLEDAHSRAATKRTMTRRAILTTIIGPPEPADPTASAQPPCPEGRHGSSLSASGRLIASSGPQAPPAPRHPARFSSQRFPCQPLLTPAGTRHPASRAAPSRCRPA